ncbi:MAG TPA: polyprenyl synthetase family protein [Actinomycetota bacterium]|nr:polyprenyl synthetase family protein [Actinomycetota bacterium]
MVHALPFSIGEPGPLMSALLPSIEEAIRLGLEETRAVVAAAAPEATLLADELERAVLAGGKRLRPVLCVLAHGAAGGTAGTEILQAAAALELLHAFALVQDDVMDRAETRRGATALHRRLAASPALPPGAGESAGVVAALLVADLALLAADRLLDECGFPPERILAARGEYDRARLDAVAGQFLDVVLPADPSLDEAGAERIGALKSGRYSVEGPVLVGVALAPGGGPARAALARYAAALGRAFQIRDDVLGAFAGPELTGKDGGADLRHGKRTVVLTKTLLRATVAERRFLEARVGTSGLTDGEVEQVREVMSDSGALAETLTAIDALIAEAVAALDGAPLAPGAAAGLAELAEGLRLTPTRPTG